MLVAPISTLACEVRMGVLSSRMGGKNICTLPVIHSTSLTHVLRLTRLHSLALSGQRLRASAEAIIPGPKEVVAGQKRVRRGSATPPGYVIDRPRVNGGLLSFLSAETLQKSKKFLPFTRPTFTSRKVSQAQLAFRPNPSSTAKTFIRAFTLRFQVFAASSIVAATPEPIAALKDSIRSDGSCSVRSRHSLYIGQLLHTLHGPTLPFMCRLPK